MLAKLLGPLAGGLRPGAGSPSLTLGIALAPSVAAGLLFFHLAAAEMLAIAIAVGAVVQAGSSLLKWPLVESPVVSALIGVALIGPAAPPGLVLAVAGAAALFEPARARIAPWLRVQAGLLAYVAVLLATRGALTGYVKPGTDLAFPEPIRYWLDFFDRGQVPIDPVRLYVGNVAGPVFATSLLAVVVGAAWFWFQRRLNLMVLAGALAGTAVAVVYLGWAPVFHLDSGPFWFVMAFVLADRRNLVNSGAGPLLLGLCAGALSIVARHRGAGIESVAVAAAGLQVLVALLDAAGRVLLRRRSRGMVAPTPAGEPGPGDGAQLEPPARAAGV